jgi:hypothetical protein
MSDFVNFGKRSVTLPDGCKDLVDILRAASSVTPSKPTMPPPSHERPKVTHGQRSVGGVHQVQGFLTRLFESRSELCTLMISSAEDDLTAMVYLGAGSRIFVLILIGHDARLQEAVRSFYVERGIQPSHTYPIPKQEGGGLGCGLVFPMPPLEVETAQLTGDLFRSISRRGDEVELLFRLYQPVAPRPAGRRE